MNFLDAALTDERDERSISRNVREADGVVFWTSAINVAAAWELRPLKYMCSGSCLARAWMDAAPNPAVPAGCQRIWK